jgi:hypothetical protein
VRRGAADERDEVVLEEEEDRVADHVAVGFVQTNCFALPTAAFSNGVHAERREQAGSCRGRRCTGRSCGVTGRTVRRLAPRHLLVAPVRELGGDGGVDVGADLGVSRQVDGALLREQVFAGSGASRRDLLLLLGVAAFLSRAQLQVSRSWLKVKKWNESRRAGRARRRAVGEAGEAEQRRQPRCLRR